MRRIAVTGANGVVGRKLCANLADDFEVVRIDRTDADVVLDIADLPALKSAFERCETVVHLAASVATTAPWDVVQKNNITGTYNVFEAAYQAGCSRLIFASSHHVVGMYGGGDSQNSAPDQPLSVEIPPRPDSLYAVSKVFGEALGRYYSDVFGMQVACIRIGSMNDADWPRRPLSWLPWREKTDADKRAVAKWLSHRDFSQLVRAILGRNVAFAVVYGVGDNPGRRWTLAPGRDIYGYFPLDSAE